MKVQELDPKWVGERIQQLLNQGVKPVRVDGRVLTPAEEEQEMLEHWESWEKEAMRQEAIEHGWPVT